MADAGITPMKRGLKETRSQLPPAYLRLDAGITPMKRGLKEEGEFIIMLMMSLMQGLPR